MSKDAEQPVMWASTLMLLCKKVYEKHQTAVIVPSLGNLAEDDREAEGDAVRMLLLFLSLTLAGVCLIVTCLFFRDQDPFMSPFATFTLGFAFLAGRFSK